MSSVLSWIAGLRYRWRRTKRVIPAAVSGGRNRIRRVVRRWTCWWLEYRTISARLDTAKVMGGAAEKTRTLRRARTEIRRAFRDPDLTLADVAGAVGVSPRQLQRIFREESGEGFRGYLLRVRMERARDLLTRSQDPLPVRVVTGRVGYRGVSGLRQAFVRFYGYNPSEIQPEPPEELWWEPSKSA